MAKLAQVRAALAETLGNISAGDVKALSVFDRPPSQINVTPAVFLGGRQGERVTQSGGDRVTFPVIVACRTADNDTGHDLMDRFVDGDLSIIDHIDANPSLGRDDLRAAISGEWNDTVLEIGGIAHLCVEFTVEVQF